MGKYEREARSRLFSGKIVIATRQTFIDLILYPYRALKNLKRRNAIRKEIIKKALQKLKEI